MQWVDYQHSDHILLKDYVKKILLNLTLNLNLIFQKTPDHSPIQKENQTL